jgi:ribosomal protein S7
MKGGNKKTVLKGTCEALQNFRVSKRAQTLKQLCVLTCILHYKRPRYETKPVRKGSQHFEVPFLLRKKRAVNLVLSWLAKSIRVNKQRRLSLKIESELTKLIQRKGPVIQQIQLLEKKVSANLIYSHFRWV